MNSPDVLEAIVLLMVGGQGDADLRDSCDKLHIPADQVDSLLAEARRRLTIAATVNRDEELGKALARLEDIYNRSLKGADMRTALQAQKEKNKLLDLYGSKAPIGQTTEGSGPEGRELDAIRAHLIPLALAAADYPLREHARIAADLVRQYRGNV